MRDDIRLGVRVEVDAAGVRTGLRKAQQQLGGVGRALDGMMLGGGMRALGGMLMGGAALGSLMGLVRSTMKRADELKAMAIRWDPGTAQASARLSAQQVGHEQMLGAQSGYWAQRSIEREAQFLADLGEAGFSYLDHFQAAVGDVSEQWADLGTRFVEGALAALAGDREAAGRAVANAPVPGTDDTVAEAYVQGVQAMPQDPVMGYIWSKIAETLGLIEGNTAGRP